MKATIAGREVEFMWNQGAARRMDYRASKHGITWRPRDFFDNEKIVAAVMDAAWLLLPTDVFALYPSPEDMFAAMDHETEAQTLSEAVVECANQWIADAEKKSNSRNTHSPESSLESPPLNGTPCTPQNAPP